MYGKKVKLRFVFLALILASVILTVFLVLQSLKEKLIYKKILLFLLYKLEQPVTNTDFTP